MSNTIFDSQVIHEMKNTLMIASGNSVKLLRDIKDGNVGADNLIPTVDKIIKQLNKIESIVREVSAKIDS